MYNIAISVAAGCLTFGLVAIFLGGWAAMLPGLIVLGVTFFLLARRSIRQLQALMDSATKALQAQKFDRAIQILKSGLYLSKWQLMVEGQLKGQIGYIIYLKKDFDEAFPYLRDSSLRHYVAQAMYGACLYRRKSYEKMEEVLDKATLANKKIAFIWAIYAYLLDKTGKRDKAIAKLAESLEHCPNDEDLKACLLALQNGKRIKMKRFGDLWYQFWLEPLPARFTRPQMARRR